MKQLALLSFFFVFISACNSQTKNDDYEIIIKEQAEKMAKGLLENDFNSFSNYTYPKIIDMMGGKKKLVEVLEKGKKEMQIDGFEITNVSIGKPSKIITFGNELQCLVPQKIEIKVPNSRIETASTLIAISIDKGENWYFIDTEKKDIDAMRKILPNLSEELVIPPYKQPLFYKD